MSTNQYRLTVLFSAFIWFLLGLHAPIVHQVREHGRWPSTGVTLAVVGVMLLALASVVRLWRARPSSAA
jgi:uncharacterized membrane protein YqjE